MNDKLNGGRPAKLPTLLEIIEARDVQSEADVWWGPLTGEGGYLIEDSNKGGFQTVADDA